MSLSCSRQSGLSWSSSRPYAGVGGFEMTGVGRTSRQTEPHTPLTTLRVALASGSVEEDGEDTQLLRRQVVRLQRIADGVTAASRTMVHGQSPELVLLCCDDELQRVVEERFRNELRICNTLARTGSQRRNTFEVGAFTVDRDRFELAGPEGSRVLTERELDLLCLFVERAGTVVPRREITRALWGRHDYFVGRSLDAFVSRLRRYLAADSSVCLRTVRGVGLILDVDG